MKKYTPLIRIISVDPDKTQEIEHLLQEGIKSTPLPCNLSTVYCGLESARSGVPTGKVGIEVEGVLVWVGDSLNADQVSKFCLSLKKRWEEEYPFLF